ncbi:MAG: GxxExxY protein [Bacteroides sp.]|nr:GxxExxY protein [Bacteroides sp.]
MKTRDELNALSYKVIGAAMEVHRTLGPGLLESSYQQALLLELQMQGLSVESEKQIPFIYKGLIISAAYRADIVVEDEIIVELKATDKDNSLYSKQLYTYLKLAKKRLGLLINFNHEVLRDGIERIVNNF